MDKKIFNNLIARIRDKDHAAFRLVYEEYAHKVIRAAFCIVRDSLDAEEIMQDVMIDIWQDKITHVEYPNALIQKMTKNHALNYLKKKKKHQERFIRLECILGSEVAITIDTIQSELEYLELVQRLEEAEQDVLIQKVIFGDTFAEIARDKKTSISAAQRLYKKALGKLKYTHEDAQ